MQKIIILDFGSQTTQLIGRRVRELDTFCEILPYNKYPKGDDADVIGVILSGSPYSVHDPEAFKVDLSQFVGKVPVLGICYGAQFISHTLGGKVEKADSREYGRAHLETVDTANPLFKGFEERSQVWMSHGDTITAIPGDFKVIGSTKDVTNAAFWNQKDVWAVQFHPEVFHSVQGSLLLKNFVVDICGSKQEWSAASFVDTTVAELKQQGHLRSLWRCGLQRCCRTAESCHRRPSDLHFRRPRHAPQERIPTGYGRLQGAGTECDWCRCQREVLCRP